MHPFIKQTPGLSFQKNILRMVDVAQCIKRDGATSTICRKIHFETGARCNQLALGISSQLSNEPMNALQHVEITWATANVHDVQTYYVFRSHTTKHVRYKRQKLVRTTCNLQVCVVSSLQKPRYAKRSEGTVFSLRCKVHVTVEYTHTRQKNVH